MAHILLIEPDHLLAQTYTQLLQHAGHSVVHRATAQAGIHAADQTKPDIVVLELQLVAHSGIEFLYEFRSYPDWQSVPVIVQSLVAPSEFSDNWQLLKEQLGVVGYLYKPHTRLRDLKQLVQEQLVAA